MGTNTIRMCSNFVYEVPLIKVMGINFQKRIGEKSRLQLPVEKKKMKKKMPKKYIK